MFCSKCGAQVADGVNFCPKCGTPLQAVGQPQPTPAQPAQPTPAQPAASKNKLALARSLATPTQKKADITYLCILVVNLLLAGFWLVNTMDFTDIPGPESIWDFLYIGGTGSGMIKEMIACFIVNFVGAILCPAISNLFLTRHMLKEDRKVNGSILTWIYVIMSAGFFALVFYTMRDGGIPVILTALGRVYIALYVIQAGLLVFLTTLHFKAAKEHNALRKS